MKWPGEKVLVVSRERLFGGRQARDGFTPGSPDDYLRIIERHAFFKERREVEDDSSMKQIIPYVVITRGDQLFLVKRHSTQTESRLHNLYSIGIGGHINPSDGGGGGCVEEGLKRELSEEVEFTGRYGLTPIGCLNDDSNEVGKVHFGLVFLARVESGGVEVAEKDGMGGDFVSLEEARGCLEGMETWSRLLFEAVLKTPRLIFPDSGG